MPGVKSREGICELRGSRLTLHRQRAGQGGLCKAGRWSRRPLRVRGVHLAVCLPGHDQLDFRRLGPRREPRRLCDSGGQRGLRCPGTAPAPSTGEQGSAAPKNYASSHAPHRANCVLLISSSSPQSLCLSPGCCQRGPVLLQRLLRLLDLLPELLHLLGMLCSTRLALLQQQPQLPGLLLGSVQRSTRLRRRRLQLRREALLGAPQALGFHLRLRQPALQLLGPLPRALPLPLGLRLRPRQLPGSCGEQLLGSLRALHLLRCDIPLRLYHRPQALRLGGVGTSVALALRRRGLCRDGERSDNTVGSGQ